jgi:hypothetical protein
MEDPDSTDSVATYTEPRCLGAWCVGYRPEVVCGVCAVKSCTFCSETCDTCGIDCCSECIKVMDTPLGIDPPRKQCEDCARVRHPCVTCNSWNMWGSHDCFECGVSVCHSCYVKCSHPLCASGPPQYRCGECVQHCRRCKKDMCQYHLFKYSDGTTVCADCVVATTAKSVAVLESIDYRGIPTEIWTIIRRFATDCNLRSMHRRSIVPITSGSLGDWSIATRGNLTLVTARAIEASLSPSNRLYCNGMRVMARVTDEKTPTVQYIIGMPPPHIVARFKARPKAPKKQ